MEMQSVKSSTILAIGWENNTLRITFNNRTYSYSNVPKNVFDEMVLSESVGKYFHAHIKNNYKGLGE